MKRLIAAGLTLVLGVAPVMASLPEIRGLGNPSSVPSHAAPVFEQQALAPSSVGRHIPGMHGVIYFSNQLRQFLGHLVRMPAYWAVGMGGIGAGGWGLSPSATQVRDSLLTMLAQDRSNEVAERCRSLSVADWRGIRTHAKKLIKPAQLNSAGVLVAFSKGKPSQFRWIGVVGFDQGSGYKVSGIGPLEDAMKLKQQDLYIIASSKQWQGFETRTWATKGDPNRSFRKLSAYFARFGNDWRISFSRNDAAVPSISFRRFGDPENMSDRRGPGGQWDIRVPNAWLAEFAPLEILERLAADPNARGGDNIGYYLSAMCSDLRHNLPESKNENPLQPLHIGVIGTGTMGQRHLGVLLDLIQGKPIDVVAGTTPNSHQKVLDKFAGRKQLTIVQADAAEMIKDPQIGAVIIATLANQHFEHAKAALKAGKDVFVEKPVTLRAKEAQELVALAQEKGCILMVGHQLLYAPLFRRLQLMVQSGQLGAVRSVTARFLNRPRVPKIETTSDALEDLGTHDLYMVGALLGDEQSPVITTVERSGADATTLRLRWGTVPVDIQVDREHAGEQTRALTVVGDQFTAIFNHADPHQLVIRPTGETYDAIALGALQQEAAAEGPFEPPTIPQLRAFLDAIRTRAEPLSTGSTAIPVVTLIEQANQPSPTYGMTPGQPGLDTGRYSDSIILPGRAEFPMLGSTIGEPSKPARAVLEAWKPIADFLILDDPLPKSAEAMLVLGGDLERVAHYAAEIAIQLASVRLIVATGGVGRLTPPEWGIPEGQRFAEVIEEIIRRKAPGRLRDLRILSETRARNTAENVEFGWRMIANELGLVQTLIGLQIPIQSLRARQMLQFVLDHSGLLPDQRPKLIFPAAFETHLDQPPFTWPAPLWAQRWLFEALGEIGGMLGLHGPSFGNIARTEIPVELLADARIIGNHMLKDPALPKEKIPLVRLWMNLIRQHLQDPPAWSPVVKRKKNDRQKGGGFGPANRSVWAMPLLITCLCSTISPLAGFLAGIVSSVLTAYGVLKDPEFFGEPEPPITNPRLRRSA